MGIIYMSIVSVSLQTRCRLRFSRFFVAFAFLVAESEDYISYRVQLFGNAIRIGIPLRALPTLFRSFFTVLVFSIKRLKSSSPRIPKERIRRRKTVCSKRNRQP